VCTGSHAPPKAHEAASRSQTIVLHPLPLLPLTPSRPATVFGAHLCHISPLEVDVPWALTQDEAPITPAPDAPQQLPAGAGATPSADAPAPAAGSPAGAAGAEPLLFLQAKAAGTQKVKGRVRTPAGAFAACFDHAPGCPLGTSYRLFSGGRCHSSFKVGGAKATMLRGETCERLWGFHFHSPPPHPSAAAGAPSVCARAARARTALRKQALPRSAACRRWPGS
jgi:hypothetical protein